LFFNGNVYQFEGVVSGTITTEPRGSAGFGYDPIFQLDNYNQTYAEMGIDLKNKISHRAIATQKLADFLQNI
jgi:XTP/dITP diphosphohydrolase